MTGNNGTLYTGAIVFRGDEKNIIAINRFLEENHINVLYRKTSLVSLYITTEKPLE